MKKDLQGEEMGEKEALFDSINSVFRNYFYFHFFNGFAHQIKRQETHSIRNFSEKPAGLCSQTGGSLQPRTGGSVQPKTGGSLQPKTGGSLQPRTGSSLQSKTGGSSQSKTGGSLQPDRGLFAA